jgi:hypothetical protein
MSYVMAAPQLMDAAATDLAVIGSAVDEARAAAATSTCTLLPAAADEVSAGIARLFSQHADVYQQVAGQAAAFHGQFMQQLTASASAYSSAEAANVSLLQPKAASAVSAASSGFPVWDALNNAINSYINAINNYINAQFSRIALFLFWPFYLPFALSFLPFYIILSVFFPQAFPLSDIWKLFFWPFL